MTGPESWAVTGLTPAEHLEAQRAAGALVGFVVDGDQGAAAELLSGASREVTAQACLNLAQWLAACVEIDLSQFRAELASYLARLAEGASGD